jgi:hypothetical protein
MAAFFETLSVNGLTAAVRLEVTGPAVYSKPVVIRNGFNVITVGIHPNVVGTGKVEYTLSPLANIEADTAIWIAWPHGDVATTMVDGINTPVTAVRAYCATGAIIFEVNG